MVANIQYHTINSDLIVLDLFIKLRIMLKIIFYKFLMCFLSNAEEVISQVFWVLKISDFNTIYSKSHTSAVLR